MNQSSANPYAPPNAVLSVPAGRLRKCQLLPLWIWLGIAVLTSFLAVPADLISILIALAYGLVSFWVGAILGSSLSRGARVASSLLWCILATALTLWNVPSYSVVVSLCYLMASIALGFWASHRISNGRFRIILCFSVGYLLGSVVGVLGTIAGAALGVILAKSSLSNSDGG